MKKFELFWNVLNTVLMVILFISTVINYYAGEQWHFTAFMLIVLSLSFILLKVNSIIDML